MGLGLDLDVGGVGELLVLDGVGEPGGTIEECAVALRPVGGGLGGVDVEGNGEEDVCVQAQGVLCQGYQGDGFVSSLKGDGKGGGTHRMLLIGLGWVGVISAAFTAERLD